MRQASSRQADSDRCEPEAATEPTELAVEPTRLACRRSFPTYRRSPSATGWSFAPPRR